MNKTNTMNTAHRLSQLKGKKVLVTGGTGFIGGRLVEKLILDHQAKVTVPVRNFSRCSGLARFTLDIQKADITEPAALRKAMRGCDLVFHCAWAYAGPEDARKTAKTNLTGTRNVFRCAKEEKVRRVVHVSTVAHYKSLEEGRINEDSAYDPTKSDYAASKYKAEKMAKRFYHEGLPVSIVQPSVVYGPGSMLWTINPLNRLKEQDVVLPVNSGLCNAVYIDDLIQGILLASVIEGTAGQEFIISGPEPVSWGKFYETYADMLGQKAIIFMRPEEIERKIRQEEKEKTLAHRSRLKARKVLLLFPGALSAYRSLKAALFIPLNRKGQSEDETAKPIVLSAPSGKVRTARYPNRIHFRMMQSRAVFDNSKARSVLGYHPEFAFKRGMALTEQWAKWANLT